MKKLLLTALSSLAMGAYAAEDHKFYTGGGLSAFKMEVDSDWSTGTFNATTLDALVGYKVLPWLSIEAKVGVGAANERETIATYSDFEIIEDIETAPATPDTPANPNATPPTPFIPGTPAEMSPAYTLGYSEQSVKAKLNYAASFHLKPQIKNDIAAFYGLVGATLIDATFKADNSTSYVDTYLGNPADPKNAELHEIGPPTTGADAAEYSISDTYPSLGLGVSFFFNRWTLNTEWVKIIGSDDFEGTELSFAKSNFNANLTYSF